MDKQYKYDAFISYRHVEHDKAIAAKLQKMLETYKPPKTVSKDFNQWRIFRDETELPTSSNLSGDIKDALNNSRFLIVVCSNITKESKWCMEEITYFKELHEGNNSNIITLVVDGEPSEVFPDELCNEKIAVTDSEGNVSYQNHVIEPLAANVVANTTKESIKKLKSEYLRIAAPLLGCGYDTLYNRNQKRLVRKIIATAAFIVAFMFAFGLYTSAMLLEINAQKAALQVANDNLKIKTAELDKSNKELQETIASLEQKTKEAQDNLNEANKQKNVAEKNLREAERQRLAAEHNLMIAQVNETRANEQTQLAQIESSENLSVLSETLWASGDGVEAIKTALSALPQNGETRPVVPDAERVLANEIGAYSQENFSPVLKFSHNKPVDLIGYAGNGSTLVTQDETGVYLWNSQTGEITTKFSAEKLGTSYANVVTEDSRQIETSSISKYSGGSFIMDEYSILGYKKDPINETSTQDNDLYICSQYDSIWKIDGKTGEVIWEISDKDEHSNAETFFVDGKVILQYSNEDHYTIAVHNSDDGSLYKTYTLSQNDAPFGILGDWISFGDNKCYYNSYGFSSIQIIAFDIIGDKICNPNIIFEHGGNGDSYSSSRLSAAEAIDDELIMLNSYTDSVIENQATLFVYDYNSSQEKWKYDFGNVTSTNGFVGKVYSKNTNSYCDMLFATIGSKLALIESDTGRLIHEYALNGNVNDLYYSKDGIIYVLTDNGVELAIPVKGLDKEQFDNEYYIGIYQTHQFLNKPQSIKYHNGSYVVANDNSNEAYIYADTTNNDFVELYRNQQGSSNSDVIINDSGTFAIINRDKELLAYNMANKTTVNLGKYHHITSYSFVMENYLAVLSYNEDTDDFLQIYDLRTGTELSKVFCDNVRTAIGLKVAGSKIAIPEQNKIEFFSVDGERSEWSPKIKSQREYREWDEGNIFELDISNDGRIIALVNYYGDIGKRLEIFDVATNATTALDAPFSLDDQETMSFAWLNNNKIVVSLKDGSLCCFNTLTGEFLGQVTCDLPSVISVFALDDSHSVGILCIDSKVYKFNLKTETIEGSIDLKNDSIKTASRDAGVYEYIPESNMLIINWTANNKGYFIDLPSFKVRYEIDNYTDYSSTKNIVVANEYGVAGYYPLYTTEELIEKAEHYIAQ